MRPNGSWCVRSSDLVKWTWVVNSANGEKVFVFAYGCDLDDQIYSVESGQMSEEFAQFNYNELRFLLDNFYGLKPEHNISDFNSFAFDVDVPITSADTMYDRQQRVEFIHGLK